MKPCSLSHIHLLVMLLLAATLTAFVIAPSSAQAATATVASLPIEDALKPANAKPLRASYRAKLPRGWRVGRQVLLGPAGSRIELHLAGYRRPCVSVPNSQLSGRGNERRWLYLDERIPTRPRPCALALRVDGLPATQELWLYLDPQQPTIAAQRALRTLERRGRASLMAPRWRPLEGIAPEGRTIAAQWGGDYAEGVASIGVLYGFIQSADGQLRSLNSPAGQGFEFLSSQGCALRGSLGAGYAKSALSKALGPPGNGLDRSGNPLFIDTVGGWWSPLGTLSRDQAGLPERFTPARGASRDLRATSWSYPDRPPAYPTPPVPALMPECPQRESDPAESVELPEGGEERAGRSGAARLQAIG